MKKSFPKLEKFQETSSLNNKSKYHDIHHENSDKDPHYDHDHTIAHGVNDLQKLRTLSMGQVSDLTMDHLSKGLSEPPIIEDREKHLHRRRASHDAKFSNPRQLLIDVQTTQRKILTQEDTDGDFQITTSDGGPKMYPIGTFGSRGFKKHEIRGTYALANLLQELALATDFNRNMIVLNESRLNENPVDRLSRMIKYHFWDGLTRRIDSNGLEAICLDPKNRTANHRPRIYIPYNDMLAWDYYNQVARAKPHLNLDVIKLPQNITPKYVKSINSMPGILSLCLKVTQKKGSTDMHEIRGVPFVVPGGRFNEMYGWDSYFEVLGLLIDDRVTLSMGMVDNFVYQIQNYGKILNANRSYYLTRSQPPFLTDMALQVYSKLPKTNMDSNIAWLKKVFQAAIKEYKCVWMSAPRYVSETGLSRFHGEGIGMPPETESSHFDAILSPYAQKYGVDIPTFSKMYNEGDVTEPELDEYFVHDRAVRESGHDTTYRLEHKCANICPLDLNCLLYKYEIDIGITIRDLFQDNLRLEDGTIECSTNWFKRANKRKELINKYCWDEEKGMYFDYDIRLKAKNPYESVTVFFALWAGVASKEQACKLVSNNLKLFEVQGGLVSGTEHSRGIIDLMRPNRQWDYPFGWAPHQIIAWRGLGLYGFQDIAKRLAYRWLFTITKSFVDFNGVVPEKFDVVGLNHRVKVEYGNVGVDFKFIPREGFGWMNSSFKVGLTYLSSHWKRALGALVHPDTLLERLELSSSSSSVESSASSNGWAIAGDQGT